MKNLRLKALVPKVGIPQAEKIVSRLAMALYAIIIVVVLFNRIPRLPHLPDIVIPSLLSGDDLAYLPVGDKFQDFKPFLSTDGNVSWIMDVPYEPYLNNIDEMYKAQVYLAPMIINPHPGEQVAIVYCASGGNATKRVREEHYTLISVVGNGKGIALRNDLFSKTI
ncbi:MAG: hypothetical protein Q8R76_10700 [Candidatus Omnitrophota bacterium]|nr:hypothetical protein [Candidatus Omnitrophota bacterium]